MNFIILLHVYNCGNSLGPSYLADAVSQYQFARAHLRSPEDTTRLALHVNNRVIGTTALSYLEPKLWNDLHFFSYGKLCTLFHEDVETYFFLSD